MPLQQDSGAGAVRDNWWDWTFMKSQYDEPVCVAKCAKGVIPMAKLVVRRLEPVTTSAVVACDAAAVH